MHDGAPSDFSKVAPSTVGLDEVDHTLACSIPDLNQLGFFLWHHLISIIYETAEENAADIR